MIKRSGDNLLRYVVILLLVWLQTRSSNCVGMAGLFMLMLLEPA